MKKVLSLVLVLTMVLGSFSMAFAAPSDVVGTEYEDAVERLGQLGVLTGYTDGTFKPENTITRAEFAAVVVRAKGLEAAAQASAGATTFKDVPAGHWASGYINIATKMGFVKGMGDGTFAPSAPITYEQAITLVTRALGYEPAAESRGGYPYGYLIVANENGLLDSVKGTQGAPASRGLVAQIVDNALEIPLMVQVSYGDRVEHIVSGSRDGVAEKTLLSELGFVKFTGRVIEANAGKEFIKVEDSKGNIKTLYADEDFDFQNAFGLRLRIWHDALANVKLYTALDTPMFDAVEHYKGGLYFYGENDVYDLATDTNDKVIATLLLDGKKVDVEKFNADYAKVVLDTYGDVIWAEGFTLEGNVVVEKLDGNVVESYGYEELSLKGYTIVDRDGKTLSVEDLEKNDIVFYNSKVKFAVVYNESVTGTIEKVYQNPDSFILDGEKYEVGYTKYLDGEVLGDLNYNIVNSIKTEDEEVTAYFDFYGNLVLLEGTRTAATPASVALVIDSVEYTSRGTQYYTLDVLNSEGKIVNYDLSQKEIFDILKANKLTENVATWSTLVGVNDVTDVSATREASDKIVQLTINSSGKVTGVTAIAGRETIVDSSSTWLSTTATYVNNRAKLQGNAVVFRVDGETEHKYYSVSTWDKADEEFTRVESGIAYYNSSNNVVAIYAVKTNAKAATTTYRGLITDVRVLRGGAKADVTMEIKGEEKVITVPTSIATYGKLVEDTIVEVTVVNKTGEISVVSDITPVTGKVVSTTPGNRIIKVGNTNYELEKETVIYQDKSFATLRFADLKVDDDVALYPISSGSPYVDYVVKGAVATAPVVDSGLITAINGTGGANGYIVVDGKTTYFTTAQTVVTDKDNKVLFIGGTAVTAPAADNLAIGDKVDVEHTAGNIATTIKRDKTVAERTAATNLDTAKSDAAALKEADYTSASWAILKTALAKPETTVAEKNAKTSAINSAISGLVLAGEADLATVKTNVATAKSNQANYTTASFTLFSADLIVAEALPEVTNAEIVTKTNALNAALAKLVLKPVAVTISAADAEEVTGDAAVTTVKYSIVSAEAAKTGTTYSAPVDVEVGTTIYVYVVTVDGGNSSSDKTFEATASYKAIVGDIVAGKTVSILGSDYTEVQ